MPVIRTSTGCAVQINDKAKVKLNETGRRIYIEHMQRDAELRSKSGMSSDKIVVDSEGFTSFHFWEIMSIFGPHCFAGALSSFEDDRVHFDYASAVMSD